MFFLSFKQQRGHVFLTAYWNFFCLELIPIRIGMPWMPIPIRVWIWQNDADPTRSSSGSWSTTLQKTLVPMKAGK
jgi:hypothetical protein